eukprot:7481006-Alexandrium_andersonii.AAC.1
MLFHRWSPPILFGVKAGRRLTCRAGAFRPEPCTSSTIALGVRSLELCGPRNCLNMSTLQGLVWAVGRHFVRWIRW